jgi:hypothetical protein
VAKRKADLKKLMAIAKKASRSVKRPYVDHGTLLYDERGLPKGAHVSRDVRIARP